MACLNAVVRGTITISSSYGADGALIGREVAHRLGIPFYDRAIPVAVARNLAIGTDEAFAQDWRAPGRMERVLAALASVSMPFVEVGAQSQLFTNPEAFCKTTEEVLREIADGDGGVILGRGSQVVLHDRRDVLRVRLDGPVDERIRIVTERRGIDEEAAREEQRATDGAREEYMRYFYRSSQFKPAYYHVSLDTTALARRTCVEMVLAAAEDYLGLTARPD